ncbi:hypothetical protein KIN20_013181 [Parelaphostrongylus tenuis]|uniref:Uncharacterized protein n=1 Tax=Parelaphostrongylus tenuis TaxID=148309 RepID=A0AAD5MVR6_PARTN|nr:hypothetical protein KIN20_013181 [Parelaphostrongylus tenuis]
MMYMDDKINSYTNLSFLKVPLIQSGLIALSHRTQTSIYKICKRDRSTLQLLDLQGRAHDAFEHTLNYEVLYGIRPSSPSRNVPFFVENKESYVSEVTDYHKLGCIRIITRLLRRTFVDNINEKYDRLAEYLYLST